MVWGVSCVIAFGLVFSLLAFYSSKVVFAFCPLACLEECLLWVGAVMKGQKGYETGGVWRSLPLWSLNRDIFSICRVFYRSEKGMSVSVGDLTNLVLVGIYVL
jgi:hypothetical protein